MVTAFVAGATGYTGREVVRQLCDAGHEVVAHIRPGSRARARWEPEFVRWGATVDDTPWVDADVAATLARVRPTHVFALLGTTASRGKAEKKQGAEAASVTYDAVDYGLTAMLLRGAESCGTSPRFVYLSSLGVSDTAVGAYMAARAKVERELRASALPWTVARPSFITGDGRDDPRTTERLGAGLVDGALGALAALGVRGPQARFGSMDNVTLAAGLIRHGLSASAVGQVVEPAALRAPRR